VSINAVVPKMKRGRPTWETALLFPKQGEWTEDDYFALEGSDNRLKELSNGCLEVLTMPTYRHQLILKYLVKAVEKYLAESQTGGEVIFAPLPVRLWPGTVREPDLIYLSAARAERTETYPDVADLVMEIVSDAPDDRKRDLVVKRKEYAKAGISEYWIVDPKHLTVTVLALKRKTKQYREHGTFKTGDEAASKYWPKFRVAVTDLFR
jgi:Uma2 family endonuclease